MLNTFFCSVIRNSSVTVNPPPNTLYYMVNFKSRPELTVL